MSLPRAKTCGDTARSMFFNLEGTITMSDPTQRSWLVSLLRTRQIVVGIILVVSATWLVWGETNGQGLIRAGAAEPPAATEATSDEAPSPESPDRTNERHVKAYLGLFALVGIIIAGLALAALIILWAGRLRRQIRRPLPACDAPVRDFWFLKPPKPTVTQSSLPESHIPPHDPPPECSGDGQ